MTTPVPVYDLLAVELAWRMTMVNSLLLGCLAYSMGCNLRADVGMVRRHANWLELLASVLAR